MPSTRSTTSSAPSSSATWPSAPSAAPRCESLREAGGLLAEAVAAAPPPGLRDRVLADIATVRPLPPVTAPVATPGRGVDFARPRWWPPLLR